jgi:TetR/AcrR family transcriptional regulator, regulator of cefoperazone and chloramphenicol sensitivity
LTSANNCFKLVFEMPRKLKPAVKLQESDARAGDLDSTRQRLINSAGPVFAEMGYYSSTVREICKRADANVAAVNYHFKDKLGLYAEVLNQCARAAHIEQMRAALDQTGSPEDILRGVIRARVQGLREDAFPNWYLRIFAHELAEPTPAMSRLIKTVSLPIYERLLDLISKIIGLPPHHETTRLCTHSVMGQILFYVFKGPFLSRRSPGLKMTPQRLDRIANHIADFSLAYLREMARKPSTAKLARSR